MTYSTRGGKVLATGVGASLERYAPVLALTILRDAASGKEILCGVRRPEANATHPNVLSVPTMRVELGCAAQWPAFAPNGTVPGLASIVEHVFARKLGLADALEYRTVSYELRRFRAWHGTSYIGVDGAAEVTEDLTMFNAELELHAPATAVPRETASYAPIVWTPIETFLDVVDTRRVSEIDPQLDDVTICVHGLCVETTRRLLGR